MIKKDKKDKKQWTKKQTRLVAPVLVRAVRLELAGLSEHGPAHEALVRPQALPEKCLFNYSINYSIN